MLISIAFFNEPELRAPAPTHHVQTSRCRRITSRRTTPDVGVRRGIGRAHYHFTTRRGWRGADRRIGFARQVLRRLISGKRIFQG